jgi:hypothetical protein
MNDNKSKKQATIDERECLLKVARFPHKLGQTGKPQELDGHAHTINGTTT